MSYPRVPILMLLCALLTLTSLTFAQDESQLYIDDSSVYQNYANIPLYFEQNLGQTDASVHYSARVNNYILYLTSKGMVFDLPIDAIDEQDSTDQPSSIRQYGLFVDFINANPDTIITAENPHQGKSHYFIGDDEDQWVTDANHYANVRYTNLYEGIDAIFYGNQSRLQYDFIVAPNADPSQIQLNFNPADHVQLLDNGDLQLDLEDFQFTIQAPYTYQVINDVEQEVVSYFILENGVVRFALGDYDRSHTLIIDPLIYGTYVGGSNTDTGNGIAIDASGNAYIVGTTYSSDFPVTAGVYQPNMNTPDRTIYVAKLNPTGTSLVFSTFLGGNGWNIGNAVAVDNTGVYVVGVTDTTNYPRVNASQNSLGGSSDGVVTKLSPNGSSLIYSTYLGGSGFEIIYDIDIDASGNAYVAGVTASTNFPTTSGAFERDYTSGDRNPFVTKFSPTGGRVYSTYLGVIGEAYGIAVDTSGHAYVTGYATSDFPIVSSGVFQPARMDWDAYVVKLTPAGNNLLYATYIGSSGIDYGRAIAVDSHRNVYVVGEAQGSGLATTTGAYQSTYGGSVDGFAVKLNPSGGGIYATYIGGSGEEYAYGVDFDSDGNKFVVGYTQSSNFVTTPGAYQTSLQGSRDAFVLKLNNAGAALYSSYLSGTGSDTANGVAVDSVGSMYIVGSAGSNFLTTPGAFQTISGGLSDAFVLKFNPQPIQTVEFNTAQASGNETNSGSQAIQGLRLSVIGANNTPARTIRLNLTNGTATTADDDYRQTNATITIPAGNYSTTPTLINIPASAISIVGDTKVELDETFTLSLADPSNGLRIGAVNSATYTILNDDTASISIADASITEGNAGTSMLEFEVTLSATVNTPVTFNYATANGSATAGVDYVARNGTITFNNTTPQTILIEIIGDYIDEGVAENFFLNLSNLQANGRNVSFARTQITGTITDDDTAGVTNSETSLTVSEDGLSDTFELRLNSQPTSNVTISLTPSIGNPNGVMLSPTTLTFTPSNWQTPQTVTVNAIDDPVVEGDHTDAIIFSVVTNDSYYNTLPPLSNLQVDITDNDTAGVTVNYSPMTLTEGAASGQFSIELDTPPVQPVTIDLSTDGQCQVNPSQVVFPVNTTTPLTVVVSAMDDTAVEGDHTCLITTSATASFDPFYNALTVDDVTVTILDNDAEFAISANQASVIEGDLTGNPFSFAVSRTGAIQLGATVDLGYGGDATLINDFTFTNVDVGQFDGTTLTFPPDENTITITYTTSPNWVDNADRLLTVTLSNPVIAGTGVIGSSNSVDTLIEDDDTAGITLNQVSVMVAEGGADATLTVVLNTEPKADVVIDLSLLNGANYHAQIDTPAQLTFDVTNWSVPQAITVSAIDDDLVEGDHSDTLSFVVTSADTDYDGYAIPDVTILLTDNDTAGITLNQLSVMVAEGGADATITVVLNTEPKADVVIDLSLLNGANYHAQIDTSTQLTFDATNWNVPQAITISAIDDELMEGDHSDTLSFVVTSADTDYDSYTIPDVTVNITDNDTAGITLSQLSGMVAEGGTDATLTVVLNTEPKADVVIDLSLLNGANYHAQIDTPTQLTFDATNWNVPQAITISAIDDELMEGDHSDTLSFVVTSADTDYDGYAVTDVTVNITDNDTAGITLSQLSVMVAEGGTDATLTVVLNTEPKADVVIDLSVLNGANYHAQIDTPTQLTFDATNWNVPQAITISAIDDELMEGDHSDTLSFVVTSADTDYDGYAVTDVTVNITDNDTVGITIIETPDTILEGDPETPVTIVLNTEPESEVIVTIIIPADNADDEPTKIVVVFDPTNWNVPQTVNILIPDNDVADGNRSVIIRYEVTSDDPNYDGFVIPETGVSVIDDDTPNAIIKSDEEGTNVSEDGRYDLSLTTQPSGDVTITLTVDDETVCAVEPKTLIFTPDNYDVAQSIQIIALGASDEVCIIRHHASGGNYDGVNIPDMVYTIPRRPNIDVFDPALSKIGLLLPGQLGLTGEQLEWVTTVTNRGTGAGVNVVVTDRLRDELRINRVEAPGGHFTIDGQLVTIVYPVIEAGQQFDFSIFTTVLQSDIEIDNTVCLQADNLVSERCVTSAGVVGALPPTGETPIWAQILQKIMGWSHP